MLVLSGGGTLRAGPRVASRYLHCIRQPVGPPETRHPWRGSAFRPHPCGRILASSLRSALWIARRVPPPLRFCIRRCLLKKTASCYSILFIRSALYFGSGMANRQPVSANSWHFSWYFMCGEICGMRHQKYVYIATTKDKKGQPLR